MFIFQIFIISGESSPIRDSRISTAIWPVPSAFSAGETDTFHTVNNGSVGRFSTGITVPPRESQSSLIIGSSLSETVRFRGPVRLQIVESSGDKISSSTLNITDFEFVNTIVLMRV
jgi:hypothetical protein